MTSSMRCVQRSTVIVALLVAVSASGACSRKLGPSDIPTVSSDTFTGVITPLGESSHTFIVNYTVGYTDADVTVTSLTAVSNGAPQAITIGVAFGNIAGGVCTKAPSYTNPVTQLNTVVRTEDVPFLAGPFCVQIFDNPAGPTVTEPLNYSLTVRHY